MLGTFIVRRSDGLVLTESWAPNQQPKNREKIQQCLRTFKSHETTNQQMTISLSPQNDLHVYCRGVFIYAVRTDQRDKKIAFLYLQEIDQQFMGAVTRAFGSSSDYVTAIQSIDKPYHFVTFDAAIRKTMAKFDKLNSGQLQEVLKRSLDQVQDIMQQTIEDVISRGNMLGEVGDRARTLQEASKTFHKQSKMLNMTSLLQRAAPLVVIVGVVVSFLQLKFGILF